MEVRVEGREIRNSRSQSLGATLELSFWGPSISLTKSSYVLYVLVLHVLSMKDGGFMNNIKEDFSEGLSEANRDQFVCNFLISHFSIRSTKSRLLRCSLRPSSRFHLHTSSSLITPSFKRWKSPLFG